MRYHKNENKNFKVNFLSSSGIGMGRVKILQITKSKTILYDLLLLNPWRKSNFVLKFSENLEKAPDKCAQQNSWLVQLQFFWLRCWPFYGKFSQSTGSNKIGWNIFRKTNNGNQMHGKTLSKEVMILWA